MFYKFLMLILTISLIFGLVSCDAILDKLPFEIPGLNSGDNGDGNDDEQDKLILIENNVAAFKIVYTNDAAASAKGRADELVKQLRSLGITIDDPVREADKTKITDCEIILGTGAKNRGDECNISARALGKDGLLAKVIGKRVVIAGGSDALTLSLFEAFLRDELNITKNTASIDTLGLRKDYAVTRATDYKIDSITIADIDLSEFTIIYDLGDASNDCKKALKAFREDLYNASGYWLDVKEPSQANTCKHGFIFRYTEDAGENGFSISYDGKNFVIACAYDSAFPIGVGEFADKVIFNSKKSVINIKSDYRYEEFDAMYTWACENTSARMESSVIDAISKVRNYGSTDAYGAFSVSVLAAPEGMVTEKDIKTANAGIRALTQYMRNPEFWKNDSAGANGGGKGECDFTAIRLVRLLFLEHPERLEQETEINLQDFFLNDDFISLHFSENHPFMGYTARYLAACYYENEYFNQYGKSAAAIRAEDYAYLKSYIQFRARRGWAEFNSMGYESHNFNTLISLYDFAKDDDLKQLAGMLMETMLLTMLENTTENGIYGGAHGRGGSAVVTGLNIGMYQLNKIYFGLGDQSNVTMKIPALSEPSITSSSWRPNKIVYEIAESRASLYPFTSYEKTHNHTLGLVPQEYGFINKYTYNTSLYSIGCVNLQDSFPDGTSWYEEHQQTNFSLVFAADPKAGITVHHPGKDGLHSYWYGDRGCCCNHFFGDKNVVMGIYYIPTVNSSSYDFIHANVPKELYDDVVEDRENNRLFIKVGDAYAALTFSHSYEWGGKDENSEIIIKDGDKTSDIRIAFACEAGEASIDGTFDEFIEKIKQKDFIFNPLTLKLTYGNMLYHVDTDTVNPEKVTGEYQYIDENLVDSNYEYTYNSPIMKSKFDSGIFEVYYKDKVRVMNFIDGSDEVKYITD